LIPASLAFWINGGCALCYPAELCASSVFGTCRPTYNPDLNKVHFFDDAGTNSNRTTVLEQGGGSLLAGGMSATDTAPPSSVSWWRALGPGFVVAATGVGAGDLIAAAVAGQKFGLAVLWVVALGAVFKWVLNEGISRWQLATGTTLIEGWITRMPGWVGIYFFVFLLIWGLLVAAALSAACGVAARALFHTLPLPTATWSALHAVTGAVLVLIGGYAGFERLMKALMAVMFVCVVLCALLMRVPAAEYWQAWTQPGVPAGSAKFLLGVMGGVGGSVTLLCYGYWIREKGWRGAVMHGRSMLDLGAAYALTGIFGLAVIVIAAEVQPADASGNALVLALAGQLEVILGPAGRWFFLVGFWCAVFTSLLGVWQGVPYLFADCVAVWRRQRGVIKATPADLTKTTPYRIFLAYLTFPPLLLLLLGRPLTLVILYAVAGAFFMPFLASMLLVMNNRREWVGELKNRPIVNALLVLSLVLFGALFVVELAEQVTRW